MWLQMIKLVRIGDDTNFESKNVLSLGHTLPDA